ncbi:MAG: HEAT repeat domain-containing protein [Acidobacteria bacterium]|nr:HEAT repeat domain-containing protein [Acidobacteriota bacterium]
MASTPIAEQPQTFQSVVANLDHRDAKVRRSAMRLLRESGYPEAISAIARLVADPVDEIQLEAIHTELSFFLSEPIERRKRVALVIEVRPKGGTEEAFAEGELNLVPREVPGELVQALGLAIRDENVVVRLEAMYALGLLARPPLSPTITDRLVESLSHPDPPIRLAAARVLGRLRVEDGGDALVYAMNDPIPEVKGSAMWALGQIGAPQAVQALTEQFTYFNRGLQAATALDALAHIADSSSLPLFQARIADKDPEMRRLAIEGLGRVGNVSQAGPIEAALATEKSPHVRLAIAFALQKLGRGYLDRLVAALAEERSRDQARTYLVELGPAVVAQLQAHLANPDPEVRLGVADALGLIGSLSALQALEPARKDQERRVADAATRAVLRIHVAQTRR